MPTTAPVNFGNLYLLRRRRCWCTSFPGRSKRSRIDRAIARPKESSADNLMWPWIPWQTVVITTGV